MVYRSPWIVQLKRLRPIQKTTKQFHPDVVIVGGGIAGIATAYYILQDTKNKVLLLETDKIAHGATGHNAGQIVSYFERPLYDIANKYGKNLAIDAHQNLFNTWKLLEKLTSTVKLRTPIAKFIGYAGFSTIQQILNQLKTLQLLSETKQQVENILVAKEAQIIHKIPDTYHHLCTFIPHTDVLHLLDTKNHRFIAAFPEQKGCTNSSLLTEELIGFLLTTYPERFNLSELTPAKQIIPTPMGVEIKTKEYTLDASAAILCTNGYSTYKIKTSSIESSLTPPVVSGTIGYMNGYLDTNLRASAAIQYFTEQVQYHTDPYYYLTRRLYEHGRHKHTLLCVGGPEIMLPPNQQYNTNAHYLPRAHHDLHEFLNTSYQYSTPKSKPDFQWHGLMGYTKTMIRLIGPDSIHPRILYNLGCNGVGILPSIYGGKRIADILAEKRLSPSIFDPSPLMN